MELKVKGFLRDAASSLIPQIDYYRSLLKTSISASLVYFIKLVFFVNLVFFVLLMIRSDYGRIIAKRQALVKAISAYPRDLRIEIKNGIISKNYDYPYFLWLDHQGAKKLLLVVDEMATAKDIRNYESLMLITNQGLYLNRAVFATRYIPLDKVNLVIDKSLADKVSGALTRQFGLIVTIFIFFAFFVLPLLFGIFALFLIAAVSLVSYVLYNIVDQRHDHSKTLQLTIHSSTLPLIIYYLTMYLNPAAAGANIAFFLLILIFSLSALYEAYLDHES